MIIASFSDPDGDGNPAQMDDIILESGSFYSLSLTLLNEVASPSKDITEEIRTEGTEHQFFFAGSIIDGGNLQHDYDDEDENGNPIGLLGNITTQILASGTFIVTLKHQPDGIKPTNPGDIFVGDTDIEVAFNLTIQ